MSRWVLAILVGAVCCAVTHAAEPKRVQWKVGTAEREALIVAPAKPTKEPVPLVFVWHGHGGNMKNSANKMAIHSHWPEALCVYPQGLLTPGRLTDPEGKKSGWQHNAGEQANRDLAFFDEMLKSLRKDYTIDDKQIYSTGHSNGGRFTYLLWAERGDVFAAVAPSASPATGLIRNFKPKPCLHVAGEKDELVSFESQKRSMEFTRQLNGCEANGTEWGKSGKLVGTVYPSKGDTPFVSLIHPGTHAYPAEAPALIAKFFKEHAKK